ncbi:arginyl-tRNA synthetase [Balamuthia mandrillaris]
MEVIEKSSSSLPEDLPHPLDVFVREVAEVTAKLAGITPEQAMELIEVPKQADYAVCVPKINKFAKLKGKPNDFAAKWAQEFTPTPLLTSATAAGPYLNFDINKAELAKVLLPSIHKLGENWGCSNEFKGKTAVIEFSSPNIAKPFHFGHLRSTVIGNFLKNVHKAMGYNVVAINYLGDWGKQYGLLAVGFKKHGSEEKLQADPIMHLFDVYVAINKDAEADPEIHNQARAYFKKMEDGDEEALSLWRKFRGLSIDEYKKRYQQLNVEFDVYSGESMFSEGMLEAVKELEDKGLLTEDKGAMICDLTAYKLGKVVIKKSDGATLYITRDIAAAIHRKKEYNFDKMVYVVAAQQNLHFQQLFKILELMDKPWASECQHINFGMVLGMSTRKGTVRFLSDILEESKEHMLQIIQSNEEKSAEIENLDKTAEVVGVSAIIVQDFSARRIKDYHFNLERATASEGDTGPYLQYAHARLASVERKCAEKDGTTVNPDADLSLLTEKEAHDLILKLARYPAAIKAAFEQTEPCTLVTYLMDLCHSISACHRELWIIGREKPLAEARMLLFSAARVTLANGMRLLGLDPLERM